MAEGMPLPWPFPWSLRPEAARMSATTSAVGQARFRSEPPSGVEAAEAVREIAEKLLAEFGASLPRTRSAELYLIRALSEASIDNQDVLAVIYPPEFLFVLDVGTESLVGGFFTWNNVYLGDPVFPAKQLPVIRSITSRDSGQLIFPKVPGQILLGVVDGTSPEKVVEVLSAKGLRDIEFFDFFLTARCEPFRENGICADLEASVPFIRYAQPDRVVRLVDFSPGWRVTRLL